jgi:endonuclease/exonuclease/phosphatase family metal-dependent hydrolase
VRVRRPPLPPATLMMASALVTALAVVGGVLATPPDAPREAASTGADLVAARAEVARPDSTSRGADRAPAVARTGAEKTSRPAAFRLLAAGKPLTLKPVPQPGDPFAFQIGTLNVLGSQHTRGSKRFAPGVTRTSRAVGMFQSRGIDLLGLQEVQDDQLNVLYGRLGGFGIWPGRALGNNGVRLQIAYNLSLFELVDTGSITTRFDFQTRPIPYVLLRNRETGGEFYVVTIHNSPRTQEADRDSATAAEIALFNRLRATGRPVLVTGDMNEKEEWFCKVAVGAAMVAANGGSGAGGCALPPGPLRIDWIMGGGGVDFSGYVQDGASLAGITDHWFVHSSVTVTPTVLVVPEG